LDLTSISKLNLELFNHNGHQLGPTLKEDNESEASLSKAFNRRHGFPPSMLRRADATQ
jgi:hypothetical protein